MQENLRQASLPSFVSEVEQALENVPPLLLMVGAFLLACLGVGGVSLFFMRRHRLRKAAEYSDMVQQFVQERSKSEAILADLDIGVLAFSSDGQLINSNPAAKKMLRKQTFPEQLKQFLEAYGRDNGIQAALLLGSESISAKAQVEDRILRIRLKETRFDPAVSAGTLVVLQDITEQEHEERQRKEFVANVSHELKTPLTTIKTYSESLLDWGLAEKKADAVHKDVWRIHDDALRMERLVEDLLLLSSIDSRGIRVRMELLDFSRLVRQVVDRLQHQAREKELNMSCFTLSRFPMVYVDRTAMERVITNLVANAIKYTERGGEIKIYISYLVDDIYVKVSDTGFGIEQDHLPRIFNRFYRVDMTGSRMFGGTGLGLSIAKELVDLHGGRIEVNSTLGKGTEFTVMIPIARKVFSDTLRRLEEPGVLSETLYRNAAEEMLGQARELGWVKEQLAELDLDRSQDLIQTLLSEVEPPSETSPAAKRQASEMKSTIGEPARE